MRDEAPDGTRDVGAGAGSGALSGRGVRPPSRWRRAGAWSAGFAVCYALSLCVLSDSFFLLAVPGLIGLITWGCMAVLAVLYKSSGGGEARYATDGTDHRGVVHHHRSVLRKRMVAIVVVSLALGALLPVTESDYVVPLAPLAVMGVFLGTRFWLEQQRWVRLSARVLEEYRFAFRGPVEKLSLRGSGKRVLRFTDAQGSPKMSARQPIGRWWPEGIADGVWFAGDDVFGGALLVPGSGELMFVQPQDWAALQGERDKAGPGRRERAERAGLDRCRL
ncbi:hypothetical protein ACFPA8_08415 [Streptomyces ovatisporus]|uniref:Integral membrane protein n=1 Tax=Streptomyces ovatisporus TaxID=1128682 RepID=A0ABV9A9B2_9ACTN